MKAFIFGAGGIIGQHLRLCMPEGVDCTWFRTKGDPLHSGTDLSVPGMAELVLSERPHIIINLAGENRPDVVQQSPERYRDINVALPAFLSHWCHYNSCHYVHVSSQAVYGGLPPYNAGPEAKPPFGVDSVRLPMNAYGAQKLMAEQEVMAAGKAWSIARPTFVLGVRPLPLIGRENPVEQWLGPTEIVAEAATTARLRAVNNRWFSVSFAWDVAEQLWAMAMSTERKQRRNIGNGYRVSRYDLAKYLNPTVEAVRHEEFKGFAERPEDTTYANEGTWEQVTIGLQNCKLQYQSRERMGVYQRAAEISIFTGRPIKECLERLHRGFGRLHNDVASDWKAANPQTDEEILEWYRQTESYIWELSSYHLDPGFNYTGMCAGVAEGLKARGVQRILCLGDGVGDLTIALNKANFVATYHDLQGSQTAEFADMRQFMWQGWPRSWEFDAPGALTEGAADGAQFDAIVSLDFLEHVTDVEAWVRGIYAALRPGGWLMAQNAFACGSGPDGSIPMHLARNDRFEVDWDPLLTSIGFTQESSNWYRKL